MKPPRAASGEASGGSYGQMFNAAAVFRGQTVLLIYVWHSKMFQSNNVENMTKTSDIYLYDSLCFFYEL